MALPFGARYLPGSGRKEVELNDGRTVKRQEAENIAAQALGFANERDYRKSGGRVREIASKMFGTGRGQGAFERFQQTQKGAGEKATPAEFEKLLMGLANAARDANGKILDTSRDGPLAQYLFATGSANARDWVES